MDELTIEDVFDAYFDCRKCKRNSINQLRFEANLESNLVSLYRDLKSGDYQIGRSIAFVVTHPKIREIWAADFRDRVVHHVIYNAISDRYYRRFIRDSYACIPGRGTHDGLRRVNGFARSITQNYTRKAWVMKVDVANFFNGIDRRILLSLLEQQVSGYRARRSLCRRVGNNLFLRSDAGYTKMIPSLKVKDANE